MTPDCATCGRPIEPVDQLTTRAFPDGPNPAAADPIPSVLDEHGFYIHLACSSDGAKRWNRAGRPGEGPLSWVRSNGLNWTGLQGGGYDARTVLETYDVNRG